MRSSARTDGGCTQGARLVTQSQTMGRSFQRDHRKVRAKQHTLGGYALAILSLVGSVMDKSH